MNTIDTKESNQPENQTSELENLKIELETTNRLIAEKESGIKRNYSDYFPFQHRLEELKQARDRLNDKNRKTRKDVKDTEDHLRYLKWVLSKDESEVSNIRTEVESIKRKAKPFEIPYQQAYSEYLKLKKTSDELKKKITEIEVRSQSRGNKQKRIEFFYVAVLIIILIVLPAISFVFRLPWYVPVVFFVVALLGIGVLSAIQLRNDGKLSEENFLKLMLEAIKQIPEILKGISKR